MTVDKPFAVILCKFADDTSEPYSLQTFRDLFTASGANSGRLNMVDYFRDMSHGRIDIGASEVFGWHTLSQKSTDYTGSGANPAGRNELREWAKAAEPAHTRFHSVVVVTNVSVDLFGSPAGLVTNDGRWPNGMSSLSHSVLGHEMGHALGLSHARREGSQADYTDPFDIMSVASTDLMAPHPVMTDSDALGRPIFRMGPGLNAATMWTMGWFDPLRLWEPGLNQPSATIELRPLHRPDLPGYLAAHIDGLFFELRVPELWDSALARPVVIVHDFFAGHSYLQMNAVGATELDTGDVFEIGDASDPLGKLLRVRVAGIDLQNRTAILDYTLRPDRHPQAGPALSLFGVDVGGGGLVIIGGKIVKIPPRSPLIAIARRLSLLAEVEALSLGATGGLLRAEALTEISALALETVATEDPLTHVPTIPAETFVRR